MLAPSSSMMHAKLWAKFACEIMTPFGSEVEPEVYCKKAKSDAATGVDATAGTADPGTRSFRALSACTRREVYDEEEKVFIGRS